MEEIFKDIPGYEGLYQVSNLGVVKTISNGKKKKEKILKQAIVKGQNRHYVTLYKNNITKKYKVHQLVAMGFLNHTPCGYEIVVDHINNDATDNRLENLQLISQRENAYKTQGNYSSQYKGVHWSKAHKKWISQTMINNKKVFLGNFNCELAAAVAYQNKIKQL